MKKVVAHRRARVLLALCLLLFQLQLFAASALGCRHAGDAAVAGAGDGTVSGCPHHAPSGSDPADSVDGGPGDAGDPAASPGTDPDTSLTDCAKCALHLGLSHAMASAGTADLPHLRPGRSDPLSPRHFYQFTPDPLQKPPRAPRA